MKTMTKESKPAAVKYFATSAEAWKFMQECDEQGISAGYPNLQASAQGYSVQYDSPDEVL